MKCPAGGDVFDAGPERGVSSSTHSHVSCSPPGKHACDTTALHLEDATRTLLVERLGGDTDQGITGARALEITRRYVGAFFDLHLRGRAQPLLDGPSKRHPEVRFWDTKKS
ncbi:hypothetical protein [Streptosporangium saharense]|uniref:hypothetical protein n=1 Tax=Streptosporangium saharense TaxID=1706840 RepID=UPI0033221328